MNTSGREDRKGRLLTARPGAYGTESQTYLHLAIDLFELSSREARTLDGNCSKFTLAGIPLLISTLRALLIDMNNRGMAMLSNVDEKIMKRLAEESNEIKIIIDEYVLDEELKVELRLLYELRNEIIHPAHTPTGTPHNTPEYLLSLRRRRLLQSKGNEDSDYGWIPQIQSHRLFEWAFSVIERTGTIILSRHLRFQTDVDGFLMSYRAYRKFTKPASF